MKLDSDSLSYIKNVVETGQMIGIGDIIIESGKSVRAINDDKTVVIFQQENVPEIGFDIGLNRIGVFLTRLQVAQTQDNFAIDVQMDDNSEFARKIAMTGKGFKVEYRCANPKAIGAPSKVNDDMVCQIQLTPQAVYMLQKGQAAMGTDVVTLISDEKGVTFEFTDVNSDKFSHTFTDAIIVDSDTDKTFKQKYPIKVLLPLFKHNTENTFQIGKKGMLNIIVNTLNIFVIPQV